MTNESLVDLKKSDAINEIAQDLKNPDIFKTFVLWRAIPSLLRRPPKEKDGIVPLPRDFALSMGIDDEEVLALIELKTQTQFGEKYGVSNQCLSEWNVKINERDVLPDLMGWSKPLAKNVLLSLYNKTIRGGLPEHYALFFKIATGWSEKLRIDARVIKRIEIEVIETPKP